MSIDIGERIKLRRAELGMTLEEVAKIVGITRATVQKYENGIISNIPSEKVELLAVALKTSPAALMGWEEPSASAPGVTEDVVTFEITGDVAAGYDSVAVSDWDFEKINIPRAWLNGRPQNDFFCLRVKGDSMYPIYQDGDVVLVKRQNTLNRSGEVGVVIYSDELATLKKVEYVIGEDWLKLVPINPAFPPITIAGEDLEHCRVLGIPVRLVREIVQ